MLDVIALSLFVYSLLPIHIESVLLNTIYGNVRGQILEFDGSFAEVYESIPYARPPVGELRFESPKEPEKWAEVVDTTRNTSCLQYDVMRRRGQEESEDCLYLKIIIPLDGNKQRYKEKLPVIFWIHGGSYVIGSKRTYRASGIIRNFSRRKMIFVAPDYRLGIEGFLFMKHEDLHGNWGVEDILMALHFVHKNIGSIQFDKDRLYLAGESAGAAAAGLLAVSPRTRDMFSGLMVFSGSSQASWAVRTKFTQVNSGIVIDYCNCSSDPHPSAVKKCMQNANSSCFLSGLRLAASMSPDPDEPCCNINDGSRGLYEQVRMGFTYFSPVIDSFRKENAIFPMDPESLVEENAQTRIMISNAQHDRVYAALALAWLTNVRAAETFVNYLFPNDIPSYMYVRQAVQDQYFPTRMYDPEPLSRAMCSMMSDEMFADSHHEALLYADKDLPVYVIVNDVYHNQNGGYNMTEATAHGFDLYLLFEDPFLAGFGFQPNGQELSQFHNFTTRLANIISSFVHNGTVPYLSRFDRANRVSTRVSVKNYEELEFSADNYYFWRMALSLIETLRITGTQEPIVLTECPATFDFRIPFFFLLLIMLVSAVCVAICKMCKEFGPKKKQYEVTRTGEDASVA